MNFSKVGILIILLNMSLLSACGEIPITFSGESDNWSVHFEITERDEQRKCEQDVRFIKYIGNEPTPQMVEYSIFTETGVVPLSEQGNHYLAKGCINANEETEIEAIIKWDGKSETIPLIVE